jgi:hypothetical protein
MPVLKLGIHLLIKFAQAKALILNNFMSRFNYLNTCLLSYMKRKVDVTLIGKFFWDLMALQDLLGAIEIIGSMPNYTAVVS